MPTKRQCLEVQNPRLKTDKKVKLVDPGSDDSITVSLTSALPAEVAKAHAPTTHSVATSPPDSSVSWFSKQYWQDLCPFLHVGDSTVLNHFASLHLDDACRRSLQRAMHSDGFFSVEEHITLPLAFLQSDCLLSILLIFSRSHRLDMCLFFYFGMHVI